MHIKRLIQAVEPKLVRGNLPGCDISSVTCDSRQAGPGAIFAALRGTAADGHKFIAAAANAGAAICLVEEPVEADVCQLVVADTRRALAKLAAEFYGRPSEKMVMVGLTGTNGKTTVCHMVRAIMDKRWATGMMGTIEISHPGGSRSAELTTPDAVTLQAMLAEMHDAGAEAVAMEISSHALDQHRADFCHLDIGVFTNLSRDHLDYHGDMEDYFRAKRLLFNRLLPESAQAGKSPRAVICVDTDRGRDLADEARSLGLVTLTYAAEAPADVIAVNTRITVRGIELDAVASCGTISLRSPMVGRFNLQNLLGAAAVGLALGMEPGEIKAGLEGLPGVSGRLERAIGPTGSPAVFVDYAHTPDAVAGALEVLRPLTAGRLICVFGAGGDRDKGKRPLMGLASGKAADLSVLTSDNPRTEDPLDIIAMVAEGLTQSDAAHTSDPMASGPAYMVEPDRAQAIALAVSAAGPNDTILIAGKGHEDYQIIGREKQHFDDREQAAAALATYKDQETGSGLV